MAQWSKVNEYCRDRGFHERIVDIYKSDQWLYKIRDIFADWIEQQNWSIIDSSMNGAEVAAKIFDELLLKMKSNSNCFNVARSLDITKAIQEVEKMQPVFVVRKISENLENEKKLIEAFQNAESQSRRNSPATGAEAAANLAHAEQVEIFKKIHDLQAKVIGIESKVSAVKKAQETMLTNFNQQNDMDTARIQENSLRRNELANELIDLAIQLAYLLQRIWSFIRKWQNEQKKIMHGLLQITWTTLDTLDILCEEAGQTLNRIILQVERAVTIFQHLSLSTSDDGAGRLQLVHDELVYDYLPKHLHSVFIVEQNVPSGVLLIDGGKSTSFRVTVRILGGRSFGLGFSRPAVRMTLVNKNNVGQNHQVIPREFDDSAKFRVDIGERPDDKVGRCRAEFQGVHVESLQQPSGRVGSVPNGQFEKYALNFKASVEISGCKIEIQTISHPLILVNNQSDEVTARGILLWDAAFSDQDRRPFNCRESVKWSEFASVLNTLFRVKTGRGLDQHHLDYLARLFFNSRENVDLNSSVKEKQAVLASVKYFGGRKFSFWTWIWANLSLVRDIVNDEWKAGLIYGFISKEDARNKLMNCEKGTFLVRFSESDIQQNECSRQNDHSLSGVYGYLTVAVLQADPKDGRNKLYYIKDYLSPKEVKEKGLYEILNAMEISIPDNKKKQLLEYLWPDTATTFHYRFPCRTSNDIGTGDNGFEYRGGKYTIEIFLNEDVGCKVSSKVQNQNTCGSNPFVSSAHNSMSDASSSSGVMSQCDSSSPTPSYALRVDQRQVAAVRPQPCVHSAATSRQLLPTAIVGNLPPVNEDAMDHGLMNPPPIATLTQNTIMFSEFAAFNINTGNQN
jgi:hypothetical protein